MDYEWFQAIFFLVPQMLGEFVWCVGWLVGKLQNRYRILIRDNTDKSDLPECGCVVGKNSRGAGVHSCNNHNNQENSLYSEGLAMPRMEGRWMIRQDFLP